MFLCSLNGSSEPVDPLSHDDVIKWKHFPRYWPFVREFTGHRWIPLTKASDAGLWCFLWSAPKQTVGKRNRYAGDLRRHHAHYDVIVMICLLPLPGPWGSSIYSRGCWCCSQWFSSYWGHRFKSTSVVRLPMKTSRSSLTWVTFTHIWHASNRNPTKSRILEIACHDIWCPLKL